MIQTLQHYEFAILIPLLGGLLVLLFHNHENFREACSIVHGIVLFLYIVQLIGLTSGDNTALFL